MAFERLTFSAMAVSLIGLAACEAPLPNQTDNQTQQGALIGAGIGAVAGAIAGEDDEIVRNAVLGGAAGGLIGGSIGAVLDRQEAELRAQLGNGTVTNTGDSLVVTLPQDILFGFDSASVSVQSQGDLQAVARSLQQYPNSTVSVIGHADNVGEAAYNQQLSEDRARAVAQVLVAGGVSPSRINAFGRGEDAPIASNQTAEGRAANRRVEIIITPQG